MNALVRGLRSRIGNALRQRLAPRPPPSHLPRPDFAARAPELRRPLLVVCQPGIDQDAPSAGLFIREGFARGWAEVAGPARLVPLPELFVELDRHHRPAVFMTEFEFHDLSYDQCRRLRTVDLFVWVGVHPRRFPALERAAPLINAGELDLSMKAYARILAAEPKFVFNSVGEAAREWFQGWRDDGLRWETIYVAADPVRYYPEPAPARFGSIKMAYVGGYWAEKAQAYESHLRPWEDLIHTFGYAQWPYRHYGGKLGPAEERQLYSTVGLVPLVTTPLGCAMAELTERYFKAPACGAFCIADANPAVREVFGPDEMLQATSVAHFHELVRQYLAGQIDTADWARRGRAAVEARHRYAHRARQILSALEAANGSRGSSPAPPP